MVSVLGAPCVASGEPSLAAIRVADMIRGIPSRSSQALTGSQFVKYISKMDSQQREQAILSELLDGNLPSFLRKLVPLELKQVLTSGKTLTTTIFVMPEYLAIGSDKDFLRIPMNLYTATAIAARFGFVLPTKRIVDAIYDQSSYHFVPEPMTPGPQMRSTEYYRVHNEMIDKQSRARDIPVGALVSGDKKDVVITNRLARSQGRIAIYGWHRGSGAPIQPLSTVHGAGYADYSHGIRLVSEMAMVDGKLRSVYDILQDSLLANVLSDEGTIRIPWASAPMRLASGSAGRSLGLGQLLDRGQLLR
jgi:hypothetical protein